MAQRDPLVEHKAFAPPAAFGFRHAFDIFQNAALEVIDLRKAAREQIGAGLFAADAAGAEQRDFPMLCRIEMGSDKILELAKTPDAGIDRPFERAHRDLEGIASVDHKRIRSPD